jgi:hypothetical protein
MEYIVLIVWLWLLLNLIFLICMDITKEKERYSHIKIPFIDEIIKSL